MTEPFEYIDEETGEPVLMRPDMWELAGLCWDWYRAHPMNCTGGALHVVLDDYNTFDIDLEYCRGNLHEVVEHTDREYSKVLAPKALQDLGLTIVEGLLALTEPERDAVVRAADTYGDTRPTAPPCFDGPLLPDVVPGRFVQLEPGEIAIGIEGHPGVVNDTPEPDASEWAHTSVVASYPSGTDPLAAIRESMAVFMERKDGTNALPEWQRVRWWHGGPTGIKRGNRILPPAVTGHRPGLDFTDKEACYITTSRDQALLLAARHDHPCLYEVTDFEWCEGFNEPAPDDVIPLDETSKRVRSAKVHRIEQVSNLELRRVFYELEATRNAAIANPPTDIVDQDQTDGD